MTQNQVDHEIRSQRRLRKTVFVVPSLLTIGNIFCGFYSVMESLLGSQKLALGNIQGATENFDRAAVNIGLAVLFDFLDGRIARMTRATTEFGLELDSIADVLSFGIAPAILAYSWGYGNVPALHKVAWGVSFVYVICGAMRLARFNVQSRQSSPQLPLKNPKADRKSFVGMPIPAGASLVAALTHFTPRPLPHTTSVDLPGTGVSLSVDGRALSVALIGTVACLAFLMVSTIRYSNFKHVGPRNYHPRILILALALLLLLIWFQSQWTLLVMAAIYVSHGLFNRLWSALKPRRTEPNGSAEATLVPDSQSE